MLYQERPGALVPAYARLPLAAVLAVQGLMYFGSRLLTRNWTHYDLCLPIDSAIPFVPAFIVVYLLAYVQWVVGYVLISRDSPELCRRVLTGEIIAKLICGVIYLLLPTAMVRGDVSSGDFFCRLTALVYRLDTPDNLFPSIHCLASWVCFRGAMELKRVGRWFAWANLAFSLLVFASVVLVKQHRTVDILAGIAAAELGQRLAKALETRLRQHKT